MLPASEILCAGGRRRLAPFQRVHVGTTSSRRIGMSYEIAPPKVAERCEVT